MVEKVFYRGMMMAAVNTWVIHSELNRRKRPFLAVLVEIAESLIEKERNLPYIKDLVGVEDHRICTNPCEM